MKNFLRLVLLVFIINFTSCERFIGGDFNADPNNPATVPVSAQMPAIEIALADVYGGAFSRFNCVLVQQVEGVARQWNSFNSYTALTPNRFDAAWQNIYENVLNEVKIAKASASADGFNHYVGVLNIIEAFTLMVATDVWDDMPYSDAFKGLDATNPTYDTQAEIYGVITKLLDDGISLLNGASGSVVPGADDVFYGGKTDAWIKAANAIKARGLLHQDEFAAAASAATAFESANDNLTFQYPDANSAGQWYRFNRDRTGDIEFHASMRALMTSLNDTIRLDLLDRPFIAKSITSGGHPFLVANFLQELITYREMQFIIAEADVRTNAGGTQDGYDAMVNGIKASFARMGLKEEDADSYIASSAVPTIGNMTLEDVMIQKHIAMFTQPEVYSDWRRTGFPTLTPVSGNAIPVRWHYSSDEYLFNSNSPSENDVNIYTDKVGWNR